MDDLTVDLTLDFTQVWKDVSLQLFEVIRFFSLIEVSDIILRLAFLYLAMFLLKGPMFHTKGKSAIQFVAQLDS